MINQISTYDKLPEKGQDVIMYFDAGNMAVGFLTDQDEDLTFQFAYSDGGWYTDCDCVPIFQTELPNKPERSNE